MLDFDKATKILTEHFANLTPAQFEVNLREYCPELFLEKIDEIDRSLVLKDTDIYQQAQQDSKLQIVPKLLNKGLSIQEVSELLELDIYNVEKTALAHGIIKTRNNAVPSAKQSQVHKLIIRHRL